MGRSQSVEVVSNFSKGLITEATGLNFPADACIETENCKFDFKGVVSRRFGLDYETGFASFVSTRDSSAITEFVWRSVAGDGNITYVVVQIGAILYFYLEDSDGALSPGIAASTIDLANFDVTGNPGVGAVPCQFSSGRGRLFVTHPYCDPFYVTYTAPAAVPTFTGTSITIKIRDFIGLAPTATYQTNSVVDFAKRPTSSRAALDDFDEYNLQNQGWDRTIEDDGGASVNALTEWDSNKTTMPALSDIWYLFHDATNPLRFNYNDVDKWPASSGRAPMGYYILNAFLQERDVVSGIAGLSNDDVTSGVQRPKTNAFYAGRVFYGGVDAEGFNTQIYFSQVLEDITFVDKCYQLNDPTSEQAADLIASDGGVIKIGDMGTLYKLFSMGSTLLAFASNGIWAISGSGTDGLGFAANDYTVRKISSVGAVSGLSFVDIEGSPAWWNFEGIWAVQAKDGALVVDSLTKTTIQSLFDLIPTENKVYVKGAYNRTERIVQWVYRTATSSTTENNYNYDAILNFNVQTGAFYPWYIDTGVGVNMNGIITTRGTSAEIATVPVTDSSVQVTDGGEDVTASVVTTTIFANTFRILTTKVTAGTSYTTTWSTQSDSNYVDWETAGTGASFTSYLITGYNIQGQAQRNFQNNYVNIFFQNVSNASCYFQAIWDYGTTANTRVSTAQQVYRNVAAKTVQRARVKARGKGNSVQFKYYSEAGKPFQLIGWSVWATQNTAP
jgi:hypothetical protein